MLDPAVIAALRTEIAVWVADPAAVDRLVAHAEKAATDGERLLAKTGPSTGAADAMLAGMVKSLREKERFSAEVAPLPMSAPTIERTVVDWEVFRFETTVTAGVYPRRYFGYLDEKADTAALEVRLREATTKAVAAINTWQAGRHDPLRVTDAEVVTTFLAEGGALYMRDDPARLDRMHPVLDVGLDNVASGFAELPGLQARIDAAVGTDLAGLVAWSDVAFQAPASDVPNNLRWLQHGNGDAGPFPYLRRYMTFEEAIAGTAMMWVWEKEIAARKLAKEHLPPLPGRSLDEQFIIGSLVYNSGLLHAPAAWEGIRTFSTGAKLAAISEDNAARRPRLPVLPPKPMLELLRHGGPCPDQPTSWLGQYHVLQRYGGYVGLTRFTDRFGADGMFTGPAPAATEAEMPRVAPKAAAPTPAPAPTAEPAKSGSSAGIVILGAVVLLLLTAGIVWRLRPRE